MVLRGFSVVEGVPRVAGGPSPGRAQIKVSAERPGVSDRSREHLVARPEVCWTRVNKVVQALVTQGCMRIII